MHRLLRSRGNEEDATRRKMTNRIAALDRDIQDAARRVAQSIETGRP